MTAPKRTYTKEQREKNKVRQMKWRAQNLSRAQKIWQKWGKTESGTATLLVKYARRRAKDFGIPFEIDRKFVAEKLASGVCEATGLTLDRNGPGAHHINPLAPSLDRKIPSLGYTKANTRMVCFAFNRAKSDWGDEFLLQLAEALVKMAKKAQMKRPFH